MEYTDKDYLGDGLYVACDGYHIILTANDQIEGMYTDRVALEPAVVAAFDRYMGRLKEKYGVTEWR